MTFGDWDEWLGDCSYSGNNSYDTDTGRDNSGGGGNSYPMIFEYPFGGYYVPTGGDNSGGGGSSDGGGGGSTWQPFDICMCDVGENGELIGLSNFSSQVDQLSDYVGGLNDDQKLVLLKPENYHVFIALDSYVRNSQTSLQEKMLI
jgi:hypothetical protein